MARRFNDTDTDKIVRTSDGEQIGTVETVKSGVAHVRPSTGLSQSMRRKLGWEDESMEAYELRSSRVDSIDDEVHLKSL